MILHTLLLLKKNNIFFLISIFSYIAYFILCLYKKINLFSQSNYIDIEYTLVKIISFWSTSENSINIYILIIISLFFLMKKNKEIIYKEYILLCISLYISYYNYIIIYNQLHLKNIFFNELLNHTMGSIHPPLILLSFFIFRILYFYNIFEKKNLNFLFLFFSFSIITGSIWSSSLFGWNGFWMWDPIENISMLYWLYIVICIHINKKKKSIILYNYILFDLLFIVFFKINIINSIHQFEFNLFESKINKYPFIYFISYTHFFIFFIIIYTLKKNKYIIKDTLYKYINILLSCSIIPLIIYFINTMVLFLKNGIEIILNIIYYSFFIYILIIFYIYLLQKLKVIINHIMWFIIAFNTLLLFSINNNITIYISLLIVLILFNNRNNVFFISHIFYFLILYIYTINYFYTTEIKNIELNMLDIKNIKENIIYYANYNDWYKSWFENIIYKRINQINLYNNTIYFNQIYTSKSFYKKIINIFKENEEYNYYIKLFSFYSHSFNLKEITITNNKIIGFLITILIFYLLKKKKMRSFFIN